MSRDRTENCKTMLMIFFVSVIFPRTFAQEESVSINKPRTRTQQPWVQVNTGTPTSANSPKPSSFKQLDKCTLSTIHDSSDSTIPVKSTLSSMRNHVRCFCNFPPCVATGYMCKSSSGGCFSDLLDSSRTSAYRGRHGCIEYLSESQRSRCPISDKDGQIHTRDKTHPKSLLVCCTNDMCNHADNPSTINLLNNTLGEDADGKFQHQDQETFLYSNSEVWFRAATIAVPICGAVILFVLIALAVKILKSENQNSLNHKLGPAMYVVPSEQKHDKWPEHPYKPCTIKRPYYSQAHPSTFSVREDELHQGQFQIPLLVSHEIRDFNNVNSSSGSVGESKNDANAKLNLRQQCESSNSNRSIILEIGKSTPDYSLAANINLNSDEKFCKNEKTFMSS